MKESEEAKTLLEGAFEGAQRSYVRAMERSFALHMLTLDFASRLLDFEEDGEIRPEERRELLRRLRRNSIKQREELHQLLGASARAYTEAPHSVFSVQSPGARKY